MEIEYLAMTNDNIQDLKPGLYFGFWAGEKVLIRKRFADDIRLVVTGEDFDAIARETANANILLYCGIVREVDPNDVELLITENNDD